MTQPESDATTLDCTFDTIVGFLLPFYLAAAAENHMARGVIKGLVEAYNVSTPTELDLVGRIIGFSTAAMDSLRLSMTAGLSDTKVLRHRCNAVSLSRASDNARNILEAVQVKQEQTRKIPRPLSPPLRRSEPGFHRPSQRPTLRGQRCA